MIWIGIDPGAKGAMALVGWEECLTTFSKEIFDLKKGPVIIPFDQKKYIDTLWGLKCEDADCICCIEAVHSITGQGIASSFKFGTAYGWLLGMLDAIGIPYQPITPQKWKKEFGLTADKTGSVEVCKRLYPGVSLLRTERSKKEDDNMAEALLMATYAKRKF